MRLRQRLLRLVGREYLPLGVTALAWLAITGYLGTADAARLFGATVLVPGVRALTALDVGPALIRRLQAPLPVFQHAARLVMRLQALSFASATVFLLLTHLLLNESGHHKSAWFVLFIGIGLPSRYLSTAGIGRRRTEIYRSALALSGFALVAVAIATDAGPYAIALAWGLREWLARGAVLLPWPQNSDSEVAVVSSRLSWREIASVTAARNKRRLSHQLGKRFLSMFIGPFGTIVARTARDFGVDRRLSNLIPHSFTGMVLVAAGAFIVGVWLILISTEPAVFIAAASVLRIAAVAGSLVIWWRWSSAAPDAAEDMDDDEA